MSVFGGDSWAREAQYRKRRVDDLLTESSTSSSSFKKLSNGKYACTVCPHNPIIDSPLMFPVHCKGARHRAAESKKKYRETDIKHEINKRIALSSYSGDSSSHKTKLAMKPLIAQTQKVASEILNQAPQKNSTIGQSGLESKMYTRCVVHEASSVTENLYYPVIGSAQMAVPEQHLDYRERREKELKFTAAGWKRDCHGKWYKDENVEFDSDEEDPNVCLG